MNRDETEGADLSSRNQGGPSLTFTDASCQILTPVNGRIHPIEREPVKTSRPLLRRLREAHGDQESSSRHQIYRPPQRLSAVAGLVTSGIAAHPVGCIWALGEAKI